uniref:Uncharacterized protein n=1 Tax=Tanacetum cinerariifolium TaxID=118510 RepID=A0A6L2KHF8_TANCI|nr:hypothetical protein [Tanacetum cinerariifolium]
MQYTNISQQQPGNSQQQSDQQSHQPQNKEDETIPTLTFKKNITRGKRIKKWLSETLNNNRKPKPKPEPLRIANSQCSSNSIVSVGIKGLHEVTAAQLVLLVYKVDAVFNKINAAKSRVTTAIRVSTAGWIKRLEEQDMHVNEIY